MRVTYDQARYEILEPTFLGYTLKSQDRLWTCFIVDNWSDDPMRGNRLYFASQHMSYDMWEQEWLWTSRAEAEAFRAEAQERFDAETAKKGGEEIRVYVINWGDDSRMESAILDGTAHDFKPKFAGSTAAVEFLLDRWLVRA